MTIAGTVESYMRDHGVEVLLVPHSKTYSSRENAEAAHVDPDHMAKAVILRDNQGYVMAVIPGSGWLKLHGLQALAGRPLVFASEKDAEGRFPDCVPGAMPPLGPAYHIETFVDEAFGSLANVYFEAGDHENLVHTTGEAFRVLLKGARRGHITQGH